MAYTKKHGVPKQISSYMAGIGSGGGKAGSRADKVKAALAKARKAAEAKDAAVRVDEKLAIRS